MTSLGEALAALEPVDGGWCGAVPDAWLQGRTAYGGFSAALALHAAKACEPDLPPLRSAQVTFVGPLSGALTVTARRLRRGRTAAFIQAEVSGEAGPGMHATFVFMTPQPSPLVHRAARPAPLPPPDDDAPRMRWRSPMGFADSLEFVRPTEHAPGPAEWLRWVRLRERAGLDPEVALIAVADALPAPALRLAAAPVHVSSMTWLVNLVAPPVTRDGWWLLRDTSDHVAAGFSSQAMAIWNADGTMVAEQMQGVAVFA